MLSEIPYLDGYPPKEYRFRHWKVIIEHVEISEQIVDLI